MANRLRALDPQASPAALFGAELRVLRLRRGLSLAALGRLVHVSGDLVGKIEKADRRPQADLVARLDRVLEAQGRLDRLAVQTDQACLDLLDVTAIPVAVTPRVLRRFRAVQLRLRALPPTGPVGEAAERLRTLNAALA